GLATLVGVPMYADIFGTIPIAEALWAKGVGLGTILSFMMGVTALSLPSLILLRKAVKPRLLGLFFTIVTVGIILIGYFFNLISPYVS
ncbi:MAG: permease, partial [Spirochaetales bacterium]|nr:permease [Spirochaetales bacterium]